MWKIILMYLLIAATVLGLSVKYVSMGIISDDPERNIVIPDELETELKVKVGYNDKDIFWRFEWPVEKNHIYHDYLVYEEGQWQRYGRSPVGPEPQGIYEDRLSFFIDDGSVEFFSQYGGFVTITQGMRYMTSMADPEEAEKYLPRDYVRKFLPETRDDPTDWRTVKSKEELEQLMASGYFLDFWHWRAHRSNPIGYAEDTFLLEDRKADEGSMFADNWNSELKQPQYMFCPDKTGKKAMNWDKVLNRKYTKDDIYYLSPGHMVQYDPDHDWQEKDVIPRRIVGPAKGSRADIFASGVWDEGKWHLDLQRALNTGHSDDKTIYDQGKYNVAFAIHKDATGTRWHYISFPFTLGLGREAEIRAHRFSGENPPWDEIEWKTIDMFYPGQISWDHAVNAKKHAGAEGVKAGVPLRQCHSETEFAFYSVESEFRREILNQWIITTIAFLIFTFLFLIGLTRALSKSKGGKQNGN